MRSLAVGVLRAIEVHMKIYAAALLALVATPTLLTTEASAQARYCAVSRGASQEYVNCSFTTFEQCLEERKGMGGFCRPNPAYRPVEEPGTPVRERRSRRSS